MKKLFTLLLLGLGLASVCQAQVFEFRYGGKPLPDGATVTIQAEADALFPEEKNCESNPSANPMNGLVLASISGSDFSGSATMEIISNTLSPSRIQWCMGGLCVIMKTPSFQKDFTTTQGMAMVQFDASNVKEGRLEAVLTATVRGEQHTVNIVMINGQATQAKQLRYTNHDAAKDAVYDLVGRRLHSSGSLPRGLYLRKGRKFMVK